MSVEIDQSKLSDQPYPFRPTEQQEAGIEELRSKTRLSRAVIVRRCVGFALPKFLSGEVPLMPVDGGSERPEKPSTAEDRV